MYIPIILLLLIIVIVISCLNSQKITEKYKNSTDTLEKDLDFQKQIDNKNYNYTQVYYMFLLQLFSALSSRKKKYDITLIENYAKNTIDYNAQDKLNIIVQPVLTKLKEIAPMTDFWQVGYESWRIYQINDSPLLLNKIDLFLYDRIGWTEIRLLLEICELPKSESSEINCRYPDKSSDAPRFFIGYPANDQLIPLPNEVIITEKSVQNTKGISYKIPCPYEKIWINSMEIVNSNLTLDAFEDYNGISLPGIDKIPFDYSKYSGENNPIQLPNYINNKWPTLDTQPKDIKAWPCTPVPFVWDSLGNRPYVHPTKRCPGIRTSTTQLPLTASLDPSMFQYPRNITKYTWLFDNTRIIPALQYTGT